MDRYKVKNLIDSFFVAKRITEIMPELPKGLKPRHIHVINSIAEIRKIKDKVCVSDISSALKVTTPSVTKLINELYEMNIVKKEHEDVDKRIVTLYLTDLGEEYYNYYIIEYHNKIAEKLKNIEDENCEMAIDIINKVYEVIKSIESEEIKNGK